MRKAHLGQAYIMPPYGTYIAEIIPFKPEVAPPAPAPKPPVTEELLVTDTASSIEKIINAAGSWPPWE